MSHDELPADSLRDALASMGQRDSDESVQHPDDATLARYLDAVLPDAERQATESHLAECVACRELALEASRALAEQPVPASLEKAATILRPDPKRWGVRWQAPAYLAASVLLAAATLALLTRLNTLPNLESVGVTAAELEAVGLPVRQAVRRGISGDLVPVAGLPSAEDVAGADVLRSARGEDVPVALAPRWSAVSGTRPELIWHSSQTPSAWEVVVVDEQETLMTAFEPEGAAAGDGVFRSSLPESARLEPGGVYLWKVNARFGDQATSSPWVPFRVLADDEQSALTEQLGQASGDPFLSAAVLAAWGLDQAALDELERVAGSASEDDPRRTLTRALLERHQLPDNDLERELARRLNDG